MRTKRNRKEKKEREMAIIFRGLMTLIIGTALVAFLVISGLYAVVDRWTDQAEIKASVTIAEVNAAALVKVAQLQEDGKTERQQIVTSGDYWTGWTSVAHKVLNVLIAAAVLLWGFIGYQYVKKERSE